MDQGQRAFGVGLTYAEVGATAGELPSGYRHVRGSAAIGRGRPVFEWASQAVMTWELHRRAGLTVVASKSPLAVGTDVRMGARFAGVSLTVPCRVVWVVDEPSVRGFAYGTLPGHPESGEEAFVVRLDDDDTVTIEVVAFSRPSAWWSRLGAPVAHLAQDRVTARYLSALVEPRPPARTTPPEGGRAIVLYDGLCKFCTRSAHRLVDVVGADRIEARSFQQPGVLAAFPGLTYEACMEAMHVVETDGRVSTGGAAIARALALRPVVGFAAHGYFLPGVRQVADAAYGWTARNRYRLAGRNEACDPEGTCHLH